MARLDASRAEQTVQDLALQLDDAAGPMVAFADEDEYASLEDVIADFEDAATRRRSPRSKAGGPRPF